MRKVEVLKLLKTLEIKNFKSIKHLKLDCKRINVFIGEPNTGKSNILESLGFVSFIVYSGNFRAFVRFENMMNLYYDLELTEDIIISINENPLTVKYEHNQFNVIYNKTGLVNMDMTGRVTYRGNFGEFCPCKFYRFKVLDNFPREDASFLYPPYGDNLMAILLTNKELKKLVYEIFRKFNLKPVVKPVEKRIEVQKEIDGIVVAYPYSLISDTIQRIIFYLTATESNSNSILIFEEPEASAFPFYTKFLAERIAFDKSNQYFISTHNPYLLLSLLEKTPEADIQVFVTYFEDYQTKVKTLSDEQKAEVLDLDASVFFNLQRFLEGF
jgi:hypothetical protein